MRTASWVVLAVLATVASVSQAHGLDASSADLNGLSSYARPADAASACAPMVLAGDNSVSDPVTAERLGNGLPASGATAEIPQADTPSDSSPAQDQANPNDQSSPVDPATSADNAQDAQTAEDAAETEMPSRVYSLQDFVNQGMEESPLGVELREDCTRLDDHEKVCGLAVLEVRHGSPADQAGIKSYTALTHDLLDGASVAAALVFPPAIVAVAVIDQSGIGESFDLVIGVDGRRVRHILDFEDLTSNVRPGDILYVTIVRKGKRMQIPVHVPTEPVNAAAAN
jgi:hypothetical protein